MKSVEVVKRITKVMEVSNINGKGYILFVNGGLQFIHLGEVTHCRIVHTIATFNDDTKREYLDININGAMLSFAGVNDLDFRGVFVTTIETETKIY